MKLDDLNQEKAMKMDGMTMQKPDIQKQDMQQQQDMQEVVHNKDDKDSQGMIMVQRLKRADRP